ESGAILGRRYWSRRSHWCDSILESSFSGTFVGINRCHFGVIVFVVIISCSITVTGVNFCFRDTVEITQFPFA
ncbi:22797_t:CDS:2, partial [Dentiscutata erythropus]